MQEYKLVTAYGAEDLSEQVNFHLRDGWTVHGNPQVRWNDGMRGFLFAQAVVRYERAPSGEISGAFSREIDEAISAGEVISLKESPDLDA